MALAVHGSHTCLTRAVQTTPECIYDGQSKELAAFTRKQQRRVKLFLLRASRPLLRSAPALQSRTARQPLEGHEQLQEQEAPGPSAPTEPPSGDSDPLPLHALQELERERARWGKQRRPTSRPHTQSPSAMDWMMMISQGVSLPRYDWPIIGRPSKENVSVSERELWGIMESPEAFVFTPPSPSGESESLTIEIDEEEELLVDAIPASEEDDEPEASSSSPSVYPRCSWPRTSTVQSMGASVARVSPAPASPAPLSSFARCNWPRSNAASSPLQMGPRCAWPRPSSQTSPSSEVPHSTKLTTSGSPSDTIFEQLKDRQPRQADVDSLERLFVGESNIGAPHCAWPRVHIPKPSDSTAAPPAAARCAWPRNGAALPMQLSPVIPSEGETVLAARCAWPRVLPTAARCAWPRSKGPIAAPEAMSPRVGGEGARCAWPRKGGVVGNERVEEMAVLGSGASSSAVGEVADSVSAEFEAYANGCGSTFTDIAIAAEGCYPRCEWPRASRTEREGVRAGVGREEARQLVIAGALSAVVGEGRWAGGEGEVEMGAAAGPVSAVAAVTGAMHAATDSVKQAQEAMANMGARCVWPRGMKGVPSIAGGEVAPALGPRCAYPKVTGSGGRGPEEGEGESRKEDVTMGGARCPWPRQSKTLNV